jgi:hypothetical protein
MTEGSGPVKQPDPPVVSQFDAGPVGVSASRVAYLLSDSLDEGTKKI